MADETIPQDSKLPPPPSAKQAAPKAPKQQAAPKAPKQQAAPKAPKPFDLEKMLAEAGDDPDKLREIILQQAVQPAASDDEAPPANRPATFKTLKKRYFATEDFEGSVGAGGLTTVKFKGPSLVNPKGQEIKDEPLALELLLQDQPIQVVEEEVEVKTTYPNPNCPKTGRWKARPGSILVEAE